MQRLGVAHPLGHLSEADVPPRQACSTVPWQRLSPDGDCCVDCLPTEYRTSACPDQRSRLAGDLRSKEPIISKSPGVSAVQRFRPSSVVFLICALPVAVACFCQLTLTSFDADATIAAQRNLWRLDIETNCRSARQLGSPRKGLPCSKGRDELLPTARLGALTWQRGSDPTNRPPQWAVAKSEVRCSQAVRASERQSSRTERLAVTQASR